MDEVITVSKEKKKRWPFVIGIVVLALAVTGVVSIATAVIERFTDKGNETEDYSAYADFLTWVVGVDPASFSDITKADKTELLNIAICTLLTDGVKTGEYDVSENGLIIPGADVEAYYLNMYGTDVEIVHGSVIGYGYEFIYDEKSNSYTAPLTGVTPPFAVRIESVEKTGGLVVIRVGYVSTNNVEVAPDGTLSATQPDKYADVTLKETDKGFNLISLMAVTVGEHQ